MKKELLLRRLGLVPLPLVWAEPLLSMQGRIMETDGVRRTIVVNEQTIVIEASTPITDQEGVALHFADLKRGERVWVEVEPGEDSKMAAGAIVRMNGMNRPDICPAETGRDVSGPETHPAVRGGTESHGSAGGKSPRASP